MNILESFSTRDDKVWDLVLKPGQRFQDDPCFKEGRARQVDANDVRLAFLRVKDHKGLFNMKPLENIKQIEVLNSLHLRCILEKPDPYFSNLFSENIIRVIPHEALEKYGENIRFHPVGSGPFKLASWTEEELVFIRNPNFKNRSLPLIDRLIVYPSRSPLVSFNEFLKGNLDATPIPPEFLAEIVQYDAENEVFRLKTEYDQKGWKILSSKRISLTYCDFQSIYEPLVRQAMNFAVDRGKIISGIPNLFPASGPLSDPYSQGFFFDIERARNLLIQAGHEGGKGFKKPLILAASSSAMDMAEIIKENFLNIGISIDIKPTTWIGFQDGETRDVGIASFTSLQNTAASQLSIYQNPTFMKVSNTISDLSYRLADTNSEEEYIYLSKILEKEILKDPPLLYLFWEKRLLLVKDYVMEADPDRMGVSPRLWIKR